MDLEIQIVELLTGTVEDTNSNTLEVFFHYCKVNSLFL